MIMLERLSYVIVLSVYGNYLAVQELVIFLIVVLLLSAAEAQFHKILATVAPRYDFSTVRIVLGYSNGTPGVDIRTLSLIISFISGK